MELVAVALDLPCEVPPMRGELLEPAPDKEAPKPKLEALRIIEEHANDLREIMTRLRRLLN